MKKKAMAFIAAIMLVLGLGLVSNTGTAHAQPYVWISYENSYYVDGSLRGATFTWHNTSTYGYAGATYAKRGGVGCTNGVTYYTAYWSDGHTQTLNCPSGYHANNIFTQSL